MVEGYHVYVGTGDEPFGRPLYQAVPAADMPALLTRMLHIYQGNRGTPDESFGAFANRYAHGRLATVIRPTLSRHSHTPMFDYIRNGDDIYRQSFAIIRAEAPLHLLPADLAQVAVRLIHACGMTDIVHDLAASPDAVHGWTDGPARRRPHSL